MIKSVTRNNVSGNNNKINIIHNHSNILKNKPTAIFIIAILLVLFTLLIVKTFNNIEDNMKGETENNMATKIKLETNQGDIVIQLYDDMPITTGNFEKLTSEGFYDGVIFHRIISEFMIQGGDPTGTGMGGPGYNIKDEFTHEGGNKNNKGTISMANAGPNTGGSQFFINLVGNNFLDSKHPAFGEVVEGMDVVDKMALVKTNSQDKPAEEIKIIKATVL